MIPAGSLGGERRFNTFRMSHFESAVDFVRADMVEAFAVPLLWKALPIEFGSLEQAQRTHHVSLGESKGILDRTVHMALSREMDDAVDMLFLHQFVNTVEIADIHLYETVIRFILDVLQVGQVASVSKLIEVDDPVIRVFVHEKANNVTADKTGAASDDNSTHKVEGY